MSGFKGHIVGGSIAGIGISIFNTIQNNPLNILIPDSYVPLIILCLLGAMFPDTDTASTSRKIFYWLMAILMILFISQSLYFHAAILGLFGMLPALGYHRGWTHSIFGLIFVSLAISGSFLFLGFSQPLVFAIFIYFASGYLSHLILDKLF